MRDGTRGHTVTQNKYDKVAQTTCIEQTRNTIKDHKEQYTCLKLEHCHRNLKLWVWKVCWKG